MATTIGYFPNAIHNRFGLALVGIFIVIGTLLTSIGFTFYWNAKVMVLTAEVLPFLILAIGIDNMYMIMQAEDRIRPDITCIEERIGFAMKEVGPQIFTVSIC